MAGMLQVLTYLIAAHLVVKGFEVLQIALASSREKREGIILIGILVLGGCAWGAFTLCSWQDHQAASLSRSTTQY